MARNGRSYDVVIVGASISGCAAATLYGRRGLKVAPLDRVGSVEDYKKVCTTFIQASALPAIERLGIRLRHPSTDMEGGAILVTGGLGLPGQPFPAASAGA